MFKISKCFVQGLSQKDLYIGTVALKGPQLSVQAVDSLFENLGLNSYSQEAMAGFAQFPAHTIHTMLALRAVLHCVDACAWPQYSTFQQP